MIQDLTEGDPQKTLIGYTLPMFISVVFQQFYNMADSMIAGRFAGEDALAAVTTILLTGTVLAAVLTMAGLLTTPVMMRMIQTPENIFADGALYLRIYIGGFVFLFLYNVITGMFNSLGDSKTPLYFLIGSSLGNIGLDVLFVAVLSWGVAGVAWATFIAQGIACVLALLSFRIRLRELKSTERAPLFSFSLLKKISMIAVPSILQQSFVSVGNIFIQGLVNSYGSGVIAGYSAAIRLNTFVITGFSTLGNGVSGFTAQNLGAGHFERLRDGFKAGLKMAFLVAAPFFAAYFFLGRLMMQFFLEDTGSGALQTGVIFLRIVSPFYFVAAAMSWIFCQKVLDRGKQENMETRV